MKNLKNIKTYENLARAFAGECQAHVRYMFIEYGARNEGYVALSEIIDKVVYEEFNHARILYSFLQTADENVIKNRLNVYKDSTAKVLEKYDPKIISHIVGDNTPDEVFCDVLRAYVNFKKNA